MATLGKGVKNSKLMAPINWNVTFKSSLKWELYLQFYYKAKGNELINPGPRSSNTNTRWKIMPWGHKFLVVRVRPNPYFAFLRDDNSTIQTDNFRVQFRISNNISLKKSVCHSVRSQTSTYGITNITTWLSHPSEFRSDNKGVPRKRILSFRNWFIDSISCMFCIYVSCSCCRNLTFENVTRPE